MFLIVSQGPEQTLERLPSHNRRHAQMFAILMFTKHTSGMGELPYMVASLAEDCNNVGHIVEIRKPVRANDVDRQYQRPDRPIRAV